MSTPTEARPGISLGTQPSDRSARSADDSRRIGILLMSQYSNLGLGLIIEPMAIANWLSKHKLFEWTLLSVDGQPVAATNGMTTPTEALPTEAGTFSTLFVIASFEAKKHAKNRKVSAWLQRER